MVTYRKQYSNRANSRNKKRELQVHFIQTMR